MEQIRKKLGTNITRLRLEKGWTQARLADEVEISPTFMMHIEHGTRGASLETVELLARALSVEVYVLFLENGIPSRFLDVTALSRKLTEETAKTIQNCLASYTDTNLNNSC